MNSCVLRITDAKFGFRRARTEETALQGAIAFLQFYACVNVAVTAVDVRMIDDGGPSTR